MAKNSRRNRKMNEQVKPNPVDAHINKNGEVVEDGFIRRAWNKVPGWAKTTVKAVGIAGLALGAYTLGKGRSSDDPDFDESPEEETVDEEI